MSEIQINVKGIELWGLKFVEKENSSLGIHATWQCHQVPDLVLDQHLLGSGALSKFSASYRGIRGGKASDPAGALQNLREELTLVTKILTPCVPPNL